MLANMSRLLKSMVMHFKDDVALFNSIWCGIGVSRLPNWIVSGPSTNKFRAQSSFQFLASFGRQVPLLRSGFPVSSHPLGAQSHCFAAGSRFQK